MAFDMHTSSKPSGKVLFSFMVVVTCTLLNSMLNKTVLLYIDDKYDKSQQKAWTGSRK